MSWRTTRLATGAVRRLRSGILRAVKYVSAALFVLAYLSAVVDGSLQDKGLYPSSPGRTGVVRYCREHPWIVVGALLGVAGVVVGVA